MITSFDQLDLSKKYTYADYLTWQLKERVEIILGKVFKMSPAPTPGHQKISYKITSSLAYRVGPACDVFYAPFDVRLVKKLPKSNREIESVVQPDIVIICDKSKIDDKGCLGAPDVVFEILSPSTKNKDLHEKYDLYEDNGVMEYWIVDPIGGNVQVNTLNSEGKYVPGRLLTYGDIAKSDVIPGLKIDLADLFGEDSVKEPDMEYGGNIVRI